MAYARIVIIANGDMNDPDFYRSLVGESDYIICVDGGASYALAMGLIPALVIGDLDSLRDDDRFKLRKINPELVLHPPEKEKSDLELALDRAVEMDPQEILIICALGGERVDHALINLLLLLKPLEKGIGAAIVDEKREIRLVNQAIALEGRPGDYLSLFSLQAETKGIVTEGLKYPLNNESLFFASTRGLSNEFMAASAKVTLQEGLLLVIKTGAGHRPGLP